MKQLDRLVFVRSTHRRTRRRRRADGRVLEELAIIAGRDLGRPPRPVP